MGSSRAGGGLEGKQEIEVWAGWYRRNEVVKEGGMQRNIPGFQWSRGEERAVSCNLKYLVGEETFSTQLATKVHFQISLTHSFVIFMILIS